VAADAAAAPGAPCRRAAAGGVLVIFVGVALLLTYFAVSIYLLALCKASSHKAPLERNPAAAARNSAAATQGNNVGSGPVASNVSNNGQERLRAG
jgi:hypothetical protein